MSVASGMNAIAHAVEALYSSGANPVISLLAMGGIAALVRALQAIVHNPGNRDARSDGLYAGMWSVPRQHREACITTCATCPAAASIFRMLNLIPVILPQMVVYNELAAGKALRPVARIVGGNAGANRLFDLARARRLGAPVAPNEFGMPSEGIECAGELAVAASYPNPRPLEREGIRRLVGGAFHGRTPRQNANTVLESPHP